MKKNASVKLTKEQIFQLGSVADLFPDLEVIELMCFLGEIDQEVQIIADEESSSITLVRNERVVRRLNIPTQASLIDNKQEAANE